MDYKGNRKDSDGDRVQEYAALRVELAKKKKYCEESFRPAETHF